jgi:uncharacterized membrane protein YkvA (DUF1232 family)
MSENRAIVELEGIPAASRALWTKLATEPLIPVHQLFAEVRSYQQSIATRVRDNDDVDPKLVKALVDASMRLLGTLKETTPESTRRMVQAAVRYFLIEDDADGDLDSILGLDDDAEVINAVLAKLGHTDWLVQVP